MKKFSVEKLAQIIKVCPGQSAWGSLTGDANDDFFTGVSTDSRTTKAGDCFFALAGENFDGHDYVAGAFAKGAVCAVINKNSKLKIQNSKLRYPILIVDDTLKALGDFAAEYRRQAGYKVVAITGSAGKTTTRQIAYHVLSRHFRVYQSPKNFNNNIGLPLTLLGADAEHQIVIAELGTNHPGEIACLTHIAQPNIAVVINVHPAHLEGLGDLQTITREKLSIAEGLQPDGILIINAELVTTLNFRFPISNCRFEIENRKSKIGNTANQIITFGKSNDSDYQVHNITYNDFSSSFTINDVKIELPLPGLGNVENAVAAWAICSRFGLAIDDFAQSVKTVKAIPMRLEMLQIGTLTVINDCYNANPASMKNALDILKNIHAGKQGRRVFICGDMAELGQQSQVLHAELGAAIAQAGVQVLLAVGKYARTTAEAARQTADYDLQAVCFEDTISACNNFQEFIKDYDIILVKGSRTAKLEMVIEKLKTPQFITGFSRM
jgi:UDP-N-acetylmuramoyl-tripeptide--D-alanyl-D-alanine ligase